MRTIYRNAITGEIVTSKYAKENPDTTVKETMKKVPRKALKVLKKHQEWLGLLEDEVCYLYPKEVIEAIDEILKYFKK